MLDRYINFAQAHPRLSASVSVLGVGTMVLGASGTPSDVENWGKVFAAVGSDGGRWLLVFLGLALVVVAVTPLLTRKRATPSEMSSTPSPGQPASPTQRNQPASPNVSPVKQVASADAALDKLYTEGHRMFKASGWIAGANILYGSPPTEGEIDRWQGRVRRALPRSTGAGSGLRPSGRALWTLAASALPTLWSPSERNGCESRWPSSSES